MSSSWRGPPGAFQPSLLLDHLNSVPGDCCHLGISLHQCLGDSLIHSDVKSPVSYFSWFPLSQLIQLGGASSDTFLKMGHGRRFFFLPVTSHVQTVYTPSWHLNDVLSGYTGGSWESFFRQDFEDIVLWPFISHWCYWRCDVILIPKSLKKIKKKPVLHPSWKAVGSSLVPGVLKLCDNMPWSNVLSSSWILCNIFNFHMPALRFWWISRKDLPDDSLSSVFSVAFGFPSIQGLDPLA